VSQGRAPLSQTESAKDSGHYRGTVGYSIRTPSWLTASSTFGVTDTTRQVCRRAHMDLASLLLLRTCQTVKVARLARKADYPSVVASSTEGPNRAEPRRVPPGQPRRLLAGRSRQPPDGAVSEVHSVCAIHFALCLGPMDAVVREFDLAYAELAQTRARLDMTENWT
jgi:hypothetical protein